MRLIAAAMHDSFKKIPLLFPYQENSRGLGLADMTECLQNRQVPRTNGAIARHVVEIMEALHQSAQQKQFVWLESTCEKPPPMEFGNVEINV